MVRVQRLRTLGFQLLTAPSFFTITDPTYTSNFPKCATFLLPIYQNCRRQPLPPVMSTSSFCSAVSFIDDGVDFESRIPATAQIDVAQWIDTTSTIFNTNSYIDDGADLLPPDTTAAPAFGQRNPKYYEDRGPKTRVRKERVHPGVLRAADEQIKNVLRGKRALGKFRVKGLLDGGCKDGKEAKEEEGGVKGVRVRVRKRQPTFVLHGEGLHVVVVDDDEDDPIDSRPPPELSRFSRGHKRERDTGKDQKEKRGMGFDGQVEPEQKTKEKRIWKQEGRRQPDERRARFGKSVSGPDAEEFVMSGALRAFPSASPAQAPNALADMGFNWNGSTGEASVEQSGDW